MPSATTRPAAGYFACPHFCHRALQSGALVLAVLASACGSSTGTDAGVTLATTEPALSTFGTATVIVRGAPVTAPTYGGSLGTMEVKAGRVSDSTLAFIVPAVAGGRHTLSFTIGGDDAHIEVEVVATPAVANPVAYGEVIDSTLLAALAAAEAAVARAAGGAVGMHEAGFAADLAVGRASIDSARAAFAALSPADRQEAANIIRANYGLPERSATTGNPPAAFTRIPSYCTDKDMEGLLSVEDEETCEAAKTPLLDIEFENDVRFCDEETEAASEAGIRTSVRTFLRHVFNGCAYTRLTIWSANTWDSTDHATGPDYAYNPNRSSGTTFSRAAAPEGPMSFAHGLPTSFTPTINFRPMIASDIGKVPRATAKASVLRGIAGMWAELNAVLGGRLTQAPATLEGITTAPSRPLKYPVTRLKLGAILPTSVRGSAQVMNGAWSLTFDTDDKSVPTSFTFDVIYDGGAYGVDTTRLAGVLTTDSLPVYEQAILGRWTRTYLIDGETHTVDFRAANNVAAHIVPLTVHTTGETYCRTGTKVGDHCEIYTTWRVYKENSRYYLLDGTAADYGTRDPLTMPLTSFTNYYQGTAQFRFTRQ